MAASRLAKGAAASAAPFMWNVHPAPVPCKALPAASSSISEEKLQERYVCGYRDGEASGREAKAEGVIEDLGKTIVDLSRTRGYVFRSAQNDVLRLAVAIARRILHREVMMSPDVLGGIITAALERIEDHDMHSVRVHPSFAARVEKELSSQTHNLKVVPDASLPMGGCVFETHHGTVDAGVESQLSEIERGLADHLEMSR